MELAELSEASETTRHAQIVGIHDDDPKGAAAPWIGEWFAGLLSGDAQDAPAG